MKPIRVNEYLRRDFQSDLVAGLTVAAIAVPQSMAHAIVAGVPPSYGLYTAVFTVIIGSIARSCGLLITGTTNATAMVVASTMGAASLAPYVANYGYVETVFLLTFLVGVIQVVYGVLRLGGVVRYISNSVVVGITAGAGVLIAGNELWNLFGFPTAERRESMHIFVVGMGTLFLKTGERLIALDLPWRPVFLGVFTIAFIIGMRRYAPRWPGALLAVMASALLVWLLGWDRQGVVIFRDVGEMTRDLNVLHLPDPMRNLDVETAAALLPGAVAVSILGLVEAVSISKAIASRSGQQVDFNREFIGQGVANLGGAFCQSLVASSSFARSAVNVQSGARTRVAGVLSGVITAAVVLLIAPLANWIPVASAAGLLVLMSVRMVDRNYLRLAWRSGPTSRLVFLITFGSTIFFNLKYSIFVGVFVSIIFLLRATGRPGIKRIILHPNGDVEELPPDSPMAIGSQLVLIDLTGDFYFAAVQDLDLQLRHMLPKGTKVIILRMREMRTAGSTAVGKLSHFCEGMRAQGITVILAGVEPDLERLIRKSGLQNEIGEENIFYADTIVFRATQLAFARARAIVEAQEEGEQRVKGASVETADEEILTVKDVMRTDCIRFGVNHRLREAMWLLREGRRRHRRKLRRIFLQGDNGKLAGVVDLKTTLRQFVRARENVGSAEAPHEGGWEEIREEWKRIHQRRLGNLGQKAIVSVAPTRSVSDVARLMVSQGEDIIPVSQEGRLVGEVHAEDLIALFRARKRK